MKVAIDSYGYHRHFGEVYAGLETDPGSTMTFSDFIERAQRHHVEGVSVESFMLSDFSPAGMNALRQQLEMANLECVWAWGHPRGLASGLAPEALDDMYKHISQSVTYIRNLLVDINLLTTEAAHA